MNHALLMLLFLCTHVFMSSGLGATLTVRADKWCPYNCDPQSERPGYFIDLLKEIFESAGHKIDYKLLNWSRSVKECKEGKYDFIVGAYKEDCEGCSFPQMKQAVSFNRLFTKKEGPWTYSGPNSLKGQRVGVINGYTYDEVADKFIAEKHPSFLVLAGESALSQMIQMLDAGRLTAFYENPNVVREELRVMKKKMTEYRSDSFFMDKKTEIYSAVCKGRKTTMEYTKILNDGMKRLSESGGLSALKNKYELTE